MGNDEYARCIHHEAFYQFAEFDRRGRTNSDTPQSRAVYMTEIGKHRLLLGHSLPNAILQYLTALLGQPVHTPVALTLRHYSIPPERFQHGVDA